MWHCPTNFTSSPYLYHCSDRRRLLNLNSIKFFNILGNLMQMKLIIALFTLTMLCGTIALAADSGETNADPKDAVAGVDNARSRNIVFILADDLGWSDTTLYGTTKFYETPNIERLSKRGMTFTNAYAASPLCSPTRSAILTGLNPARTGLTAPNCHLPAVKLKATRAPSGAANQKAASVSSVTRLDPKYYTVSEALQDAGYATGHFGKWHLGGEPFSPLENGFDVDIPHWPGPGPAGSFVAPWKYPDFDPNTPDEHIEDRMASEAVEFMERNKDQPFFLNYWMFSVHAPFDAKKDLIEKYRSKIDAVSEQKSPTYAAMVESMDDAVGTLLDAIDRLGIADNTIIVFASDNGGNMYNWVDETVPTSNAPLRGGKATMYEGGVRGPCTVVWPNRTKADSRSSEVIQSCDFYPTILEMLDMEKKEDQEFDGVSIVAALEGGQLDRAAIFTYFPHSPGVPDWLPPSVSIHKGDWKLIRLFNNGQDGAHRWKLFNLADDIGEKTDLAASQPKRVKELDARITRFLEDTQAVVPVSNPNFDPLNYDVAEEGKAEPKGKNPKKPVAKRPPTPRVAGWQAAGTASLKLDDNKLVVTSDGGDPFLTFDLPDELPPGNLTLKVTITSNSSGGGQVFWAHKLSRPKFVAARRAEFEMTHNGKPHAVSVVIPSKNPLTAIRLDPAKGAGEITISSAEIFNDGKSIYQWDFSD